MEEYKLNKKRVVFASIAGLLLILSGIIFILYPEALSKYGLVRNPTIIKAIGIGAVICMIPLSIGMFTLLFSTYGLKITEEGFINNTNMTNIGIINWKDIENIRIQEINKKSKIILITVKDEKKYYDQIKNPLKKMNILMYNKTYKASFVIDPHKLFISTEEIVSALRKHQNIFADSQI